MAASGTGKHVPTRSSADCYADARLLADPSNLLCVSNVRCCLAGTRWPQNAGTPGHWDARSPGRWGSECWPMCSPPASIVLLARAGQPICASTRRKPANMHLKPAVLNAPCWAGQTLFSRRQCCLGDVRAQATGCGTPGCWEARSPAGWDHVLTMMVHVALQRPSCCWCQAGQPTCLSMRELTSQQAFQPRPA